METRGRKVPSPSSSDTLQELNHNYYHHPQQLNSHRRSVSEASLHSNRSGVARTVDDTEGHKGHNNNKHQVCTVRGIMSYLSCFGSLRLVVLVALCLQNSLFTVLRRYSQGILKEKYSSYECLLLGEFIKMVFSAYMIARNMESNDSSSNGDGSSSIVTGNNRRRLYMRLFQLVRSSGKMLILALIYGIMNILSFVALRNIGAGMFTIFSQCKILTTATFSAILLQRQYSSTQWRALTALVFGVLLFSEPLWSKSENLLLSNADARPFLGVLAVLIEVTMSGFASIYFEKVIKQDSALFTIWERNFQLALGSFPVYLMFDFSDPAPGGIGTGWSFLGLFVSISGAAGGLLVALSIKYGDSILKTLATTGAIVLSSILDYFFLNGPLTPIMMIAGVQVVLAICNYTLDATVKEKSIPEQTEPKTLKNIEEPHDEEIALLAAKSSRETPSTRTD